MRILVVCGAGASSTFVAQRVRRAAQAAGRDVSAVAGTVDSLPVDLDGADVVLVGPHLHTALDRIRAAASAHGTRVILLPTDAFSDRDGTRTLALVDQPLTAEAPRAHDIPTERTPA